MPYANDSRLQMYLTGVSGLVFKDRTTLSTDTVFQLNDLGGQILETQLPTNIGAGSSLLNFDIGTF